MSRKSKQNDPSLLAEVYALGGADFDYAPRSKQKSKPGKYSYPKPVAGGGGGAARTRTTAEVAVSKQKKWTFTRVLAEILGLIGELLMTAAFLIGLYMFWALVWTNYVGQQNEEKAVASLQQEWKPVPGQENAEKRTDTPPPVKTVPFAQTYATVWIPRFDRSRIALSEGVDREKILNVKGAGHYPGTAQPGEVGNFAIAGHRTSYGKPFNEIANLEPGDQITIETADAWYVYTYEGDHEVISPYQVNVINPVPKKGPDVKPTERYLTMTACHPFYSARERYVIHAKFSYWTPKSEGYPASLSELMGAK